MELYETRLKSISFLPIRDHSYAQAPYQEITKEVYERAKAKLGPLNFENVNTDEVQDMYCDGDKCTFERPAPEPEQAEVTFESESEEVGAPVPAEAEVEVPVK